MSRIIARVRGCGDVMDVEIMDVSESGLSILAPRTPDRGQILEIQIGRNRMAGQVRWVRGQRFGVALRERIDVARLNAGRDDFMIVSDPTAATPRKQKEEEEGFRLYDLLFIAAAMLAAAGFLSRAFF